MILYFQTLQRIINPIISPMSIHRAIKTLTNGHLKSVNLNNQTLKDNKKSPPNKGQESHTITIPQPTEKPE